MKRAVITGASGGIGAEFAKLLAAKKVDLFLVARRTEQLNLLAVALQEKYGINVETKNGDVDCLINNAGIGPWKKFVEAPLEDHKKIMQLNMVTLTTSTHLFVKHMLSHKKESLVINVASVAAFQPAPRFTIYAPSKTYVKIFSEILNEELKGTNVRISCLCPGGTATDFLVNNNQTLKGFNPLMSSESVARAGLEGALRGKVIVIPGLVNKLFAFFPRLIPSGWMVKISGWGMNLAVKETK
jgi:uncharacterized protein